MKNYIKISCLAVVPFIAASCANLGGSSSGSLGTYRAYDRPATLPTNPNAVKVKVSTSNQMVYVMEGNKPLLVMPVSVGTAKTPTPKGNFRAYYKDADRRAQTHGFAVMPTGQIKGYSKKRPVYGASRKVGTPMPYWTEFQSGYGFHTGWMKTQPCTHGCIRMHENLSPKFFRLVKVGTPINISSSQPEDRTIGRNIKRPIDAGPLEDYSLETRMSSKIFKNHKRPSFQ